ncbi:hypothetical protein G9H65_09470 [Cytophagaceae bacterium 50A-KIRBA]|uniref:hypothetical protein n=1 Tax=Aquirufa ecclesiirivi TaxID=2715124 RepID=UPI001409F696|nr:hypothetical protein [Aquirufa ecclesiirivi]NHC49563.1 hypothetical protein [Aquirufa ecclesiirivi]
MNKNDQKIPLENTNETVKKNWISPNLKAWESVNIELAGGKGVDGGLHASYA